MSYSREYMTRNLMNWNPHWNRQTVEGWSLEQLYSVFMKEQRKTVALLFVQLGINQ